MTRTRVKICGLTRREDALLAATLGADALGCVCVPGSRRGLTPDKLAGVFADLPLYITRVAVVANPDAGLLAALAKAPVDLVQFHGNESPQQIAACPLPWYKAVRGVAGYAAGTRDFPTSPALLVDAPQGGGQGRAWDWQALPPPGNRPVPIVLAGGLTPENAAEAITRVRPWGIDLASGVESEPGIKDPGKLERLFAQLHQ